MKWHESVTRAMSDLFTAHALAGPVSGPGDGLFVGLFSAHSAPIGRRTLRTDVTESAYSGYARVSLAAWSAGLDDDAAAREKDGPRIDFRGDATDPFIQDTALGVMLLDANVAGVLKGAELFPGGPIEISGPSQGFSLLVRSLLSYDWDSGAVVLIR